MVLYDDNAAITAPTIKNIKDFVKELRQEGFNLEIKGNSTKYLGIGTEEQTELATCCKKD